jgi:hypothetical protein
MNRLTNILFFSILIISTHISNELLAQDSLKFQTETGFYFSWGYNKDYYTNTNIYVSQPALNNNFNFKNTVLTDHPGWDEGLFNTELSIPQYNYRFGYFFDKNNLSY